MIITGLVIKLNIVQFCDFVVNVSDLSDLVYQKEMNSKKDFNDFLKQLAQFF